MDTRCIEMAAAFLVVAVLTPARGEPTGRPRQGGLVFSVRTWEGDYASKDVPSGVQTTPVVGTIYAVNADGTGLRKVVVFGKNTYYTTVSPDVCWLYFQSNAC